MHHSKFLTVAFCSDVFILKTHNFAVVVQTFISIFRFERILAHMLLADFEF